MISLLLALIYVCFICLGLPDSLLGSAWPVLHNELNVSISYAGIVSIIIFVGTIVSSLFSDKLRYKFGFGKVTAFSITMTAGGLLGFAVSNKFWMLLLWSIPYGLGAGGVDAILNNYVALHYKAQHMSWLHCMWGVGAAISPYIMSFSLLRFDKWNYGYLFVFIIQIILSIVVFFSLPLWKNGIENSEDNKAEITPVKFKEIFRIKGTIPCFITFFTYCSLELTTSLWASSYLVDKWNINPETAAGLASMFYIGITVGRFVNGFLAMRFEDSYLIRMGCSIILVGIILLIIPTSSITAVIGFVVMGLGCAPIYPCIIHMTPKIFGADKSQAMIGIQMAFAYTGFLLMPPLFGVVADCISISLLPLYVFVLLIVMFVMHERVLDKKI